MRRTGVAWCRGANALRGRRPLRDRRGGGPRGDAYLLPRERPCVLENGGAPLRGGALPRGVARGGGRLLREGRAPRVRPRALARGGARGGRVHGGGGGGAARRGGGDARARHGDRAPAAAEAEDLRGGRGRSAPRAVGSIRGAGPGSVRVRRAGVGRRERAGARSGHSLVDLRGRVDRRPGGQCSLRRRLGRRDDRGIHELYGLPHDSGRLGHDAEWPRRPRHAPGSLAALLAAAPLLVLRRGGRRRSCQRSLSRRVGRRDDRRGHRLCELPHDPGRLGHDAEWPRRLRHTPGSLAALLPAAPLLDLRRGELLRRGRRALGRCLGRRDDRGGDLFCRLPHDPGCMGHDVQRQRLPLRRLRHSSRPLAASLPAAPLLHFRGRVGRRLGRRALERRLWRRDDRGEHPLGGLPHDPGRLGHDAQRRLRRLRHSSRSLAALLPAAPLFDVRRGGRPARAPSSRTTPPAS